jgi:dihydroneopterin aldolase
MAHYAHILTLKRLGVSAHLGFYDEERGVRQPVEISLRLYFPEPPACVEDDHADFLHYGELAEAITRWAEAGDFRLIEFMGMAAFRFVRAYLDERGHKDVKLWAELTKCKPPVNLLGGSSYLHSDLPPDATTAYAVVL